MKITHAEKWRVVVPLRDGVLETTGRFAIHPRAAGFATPKWLIRLHSDNGFAGIGESWRGDSQDAIDSALASVLGRDPRELDHDTLALTTGSAFTTVEMAIIDLLGHYHEVPAHELLGGARRREVAVSAWGYRHAPDRFAEIAVGALEQGFSSFKFKAALADPPRLIGEEGRETLEDDPVVDSVRAISSACGSTFEITVDANCRFYTLERALELANALEGMPVVFEDPISWQTDLALYPLLRRRAPVDIAIHVASLEAMAANVAGGAVGYAVHSSSEALLRKVIELGAADRVNLGGSMREFVRLAQLAAEGGLSCWHESGLDLGVRDASYIHASFAAESCTIAGDMVGHLLRADDLVLSPLPITNGRVALPQAPGLGVELDEEALRTWAVADDVCGLS